MVGAHQPRKPGSAQSCRITTVYRTEPGLVGSIATSAAFNLPGAKEILIAQIHPIRTGMIPRPSEDLFEYYQLAKRFIAGHKVPCSSRSDPSETYPLPKPAIRLGQILAFKS